MLELRAKRNMNMPYNVHDLCINDIYQVYMSKIIYIILQVNKVIEYLLPFEPKTKITC